MTMQRYCHRRADIAFRLGIPLADVTDDLTFDYELGYMDEGACSVLWPVRVPVSVLSSGPYTVPLARSREPYTVSPTLYAAVREPFPDDGDWPRALPTRITDGSGGNG